MKFHIPIPITTKSGQRGYRKRFNVQWETRARTKVNWLTKYTKYEIRVSMPRFQMRLPSPRGILICLFLWKKKKNIYIYMLTRACIRGKGSTNGVATCAKKGVAWVIRFHVRGIYLRTWAHRKHLVLTSLQYLHIWPYTLRPRIHARIHGKARVKMSG